MTHSFEKLDVWQKSRVLVKDIYQATSSFPSEEKFGLTSQVRRAAISVSSNIAEGSVRWSQKEKARFYEISYGSLIEVLNQLILANDLGFLKEDKLVTLRTEISSLIRMISALYNSTKSKLK